MPEPASRIASSSASTRYTSVRSHPGSSACRNGSWRTRISAIRSRRTSVLTTAAPSEGHHTALAGRRQTLLLGPVAGANERPGEDAAEPHLLALLAEPRERRQRHPPVERQVLAGRLQVLPDRDHVDVVRAQVAHGLEDLLVRLPHAGHDPGLRHQRPALRPP